MTDKTDAELIERLKREAEFHAMEARAANASLRECYQVVTGATGEPGTWNGARPIREAFASLRKQLDEARERNHFYSAIIAYLENHFPQQYEEAAAAALSQEPPASHAPKFACSGCGSTETIEEIRSKHPQAIACCPERSMNELIAERDARASHAPVLRDADTYNREADATERAVMLMRIAAAYIQEYADCMEVIFYDDAECDGSCLADDLEACAEDLAMLTAPAPAISYPEPALAPGHTDLMVDPDTLDAFMEANPLPPDPAPAISGGMVSVPREATPEMLAAFWRQKNRGCQTLGGWGSDRDDYSAYRAMIAAADRSAS